MTVRLPGLYPTRCRAVVHNGIVSLVAVAPDKVPSMYEQAKAALADVDRTLAEAGSSKDRILTAMVYIADMERKEEMNRAWDEWADRKNPPMRACVAVTLTGKSLIEIVLTAAV
jgi:enamine deaminase RidA (YjgF/YER057c/UK114 family)